MAYQSRHLFLLPSKTLLSYYKWDSKAINPHDKEFRRSEKQQTRQQYHLGS
jgi:hypothetical protein